MDNQFKVMDNYPVIEVDRDLAERIEELGTKRKFWFRPLVHDANGLLFKADERVAGGSETVGTGEDWAEKIACEICSLLGIPHVQYELAVEKQSGVSGVVCPNIALAPLTLVLGNQLLLERDASYPADDALKYGVRQHSIESVSRVLAKLGPPPKEYCENLPHGIESASDVFVGYVMLDALVANQDRHHQNWGALRGETSMLAPTFDHGAGLGRNEPDAKRYRRLYGPDPAHNVQQYASKAKSSFYKQQDQPILRTVAAFKEFATQSPRASSAWLDRLEQLSIGQIDRIIDPIPADRMSQITREFTQKLILANQARLLAD
jgi:hypothetical protein